MKRTENFAIIFVQDFRLNSELLFLKRISFDNCFLVTFVDMTLGDKVIEGKTKIVYALPKFQDGNCVLLQSKDSITCGDGARKNEMEGKSALSNATTCAIFELLNKVGIKTHFIKRHSETSFIARKCEMIPLEVVNRRLATGSFLKRNPGVKEGFRFAPPLLETFFKDDANHDPQWSRQQCIENALCIGGVTIGKHELDLMGQSSTVIFEILEKAWAYRGCALIDMKVEFGVDSETKEIILADVVDNDSWRLWPAGDKRLMRDKQVYRNLKEVTPAAMEEIKKNYKWVADEAQQLITKPTGRVVILMGSASDVEHGKKIQKRLDTFGIPSDLRVTSAHKGTVETLRILHWYESHNIPTVFIAIAGRSNGLGPVLSGNTAYPVINCPPVKADWGSQDIWSSMRLPSGLGCSTIIDPDGAGIAAAQILGMYDHIIWSHFRAVQLKNALTLMEADKNLLSKA